MFEILIMDPSNRDSFKPSGDSGGWINETWKTQEDVDDDIVRLCEYNTPSKYSWLNPMPDSLMKYYQEQRNKNREEPPKNYLNDSNCPFASISSEQKRTKRLTSRDIESTKQIGEGRSDKELKTEISQVRSDAEYSNRLDSITTVRRTIDRLRSGGIERKKQIGQVRPNIELKQEIGQVRSDVEYSISRGRGRLDRLTPGDIALIEQFGDVRTGRVRSHVKLNKQVGEDRPAEIRSDIGYSDCLASTISGRERIQSLILSDKELLTMDQASGLEDPKK